MSKDSGTEQPAALERAREHLLKNAYKNVATCYVSVGVLHLSCLALACRLALLRLINTLSGAALALIELAIRATEGERER